MPYKNYIVKQTGEGELHPEETLADVWSKHSVVETPVSRRVFRVVYGGLLILGLIIIGRSTQIQLVDGTRYFAIVQRNAALRYLGPGFRGIIYDRTQTPLVENIPLFDLLAVQKDLPADAIELEKTLATVAEILPVPPGELAALFSANTRAASFIVHSGLSKEAVARLEVAGQPGFYVIANAQRYYPAGAAVASVLGYTAKVGEEDMAKDDFYALTDRIGRFGLEKFYEEYLRGEHRSVLLRDNQGANYQSTALPGHDLILNLDNAIQTKLYQVMNQILLSAGLKSGAAIAQDPRTGAVLGLVSFPAFDANLFESAPTLENTSKINRLLNDKNQPLFNRVVNGRYSPGSTIKPLLALAGLKEKIVTSQTIVNATGSITVPSVYDPSIVYTFRDWKVHGWTDIKKAIADSVDVYFYALGGGYGEIKGLGAEKIMHYFKTALIDSLLGIDLPGEVAGFVPTEEWKQANKGEDWYIGDTYNISIGQGDLLVTPLWLGAYVGALANGGDLFQPQLLKSIRDPDGRVVLEKKPKSLAQLPFDDKTMATVRSGMRQTVTAGTALALQTLPVAVAAKTGTAQVNSGRNLNSLFIVYGPEENPSITLTVLIEHVESQGLAIQTAHDFLQWYFGEKAGREPATN